MIIKTTKTILLVEDEPTIAMTEANTLKKHGYEVIIAYKGEEAVVIASENKEIDLILMDIDLGKGIDGIEAAQIILQSREIPVVFFLNHAESEIVERTEKITSYGFFVKNTGEAVLLATIKTAFKLFNAHTTMLENVRRLNMSLEGTGIGLWDMNFRTQQVYRNDNWFAMLGYELNEASGSLDFWKGIIHPDDYEYVIKETEKHHKGLTEYLKVEHRLRCKDGSYKWILNWGKIFERDKKGEPLRALGVHIDINEKKLAEESLRKNKNKLQSIFKAAPIGFGLTSNRILIEVNERICSMLGYSCDELVGKSARVLYPTQEEFEYVGSAKYDQIANHGIGTVETRWQRKDGSIINILLSSIPLNLEDITAGVTFTAIDITERKRVEEALQTSLVKYQVLFDSFPLGITVSDQAGNILESNKQAERLLGITTQEQNSRQIDSKEWYIIKTNGSIMLPEEYASVIALKENRLVENVQMGIVKKDEEIAWINVTAAPIPLKDYGVAVAYGDISERIKYEEELKQSEEKYRRFFEEDLSGIFISTPEGKIKACNQAYVKMMEYNSIEELLSSNPVEHYDNPQKRIDFLNLLRKERKLNDFRAEVITKNGKKIYTLENIIGIFDKNDTLVEFWGYVNDITEKRNAEIALRNAAAEKEALHKELLHRVKNSFNLIKSLIFIERDKIKDPKASKVLENIEMRITALAQMYSILNDSGVSKKINLGAYLRQLTDTLSLTYIKNYEKVKVQQFYDNVFTTTRNATSVGLIVSELVTNSLKYAFPDERDGIITISLELIDKKVNITVSDNGIGVSEDFDIENSAGLGTQLVSMLAKQLNGTITLNKETGVSYTIIFPIDE
ncbi:MAG: PAS domain S-box protein [Ignavibacterium sp.]|jgi:PAS domain S-box-containing protein|nr:PAS domain S-box protein [Ignavibacterium sp.]